MATKQFDYEQKYRDLQERIEELGTMAELIDNELLEEINNLRQRVAQHRERKYKTLSAWDRVLMNRSADRLGAADYIYAICDDWIELHGDRLFGDDPAIIGGIGIFKGLPVTIIGYRKGKNTSERVQYNFGMPHPDGYRKAHRLLLQAEKFKRPVLTFVDTQGAYPGVDAEQRGQAWAISKLLITLSTLKTPVIALVSGEGGSGGALALSVADRLLMLSNAVFAVVSPEACASILWRNAEKAEEMAAVMKLTAQDLRQLGMLDEVIEEPVGGAHLDIEATVNRVKEALFRNLQELIHQDIEELCRKRFMKLRNIGVFVENQVTYK
ncbi:MAG: acetyl-CoA carboxylase carboxyltransferase subunit alpha [Candidatus Saccharibacteria bacterium]